MKDMNHPLRADLPPLPGRIACLPVDKRGYPVPWFVAWVDGEPEFRAADGAKLTRAIRDKLCWVCGQPLGQYLAFIIGPMCAVNRISAEPPSHRECAEFSLRACPFLSKPQMDRRENDLPENTRCAGFMIRRNPGAMLLWITRDYRIVGDGNGGVLFRLPSPMELVPYSSGRRATLEELQEAFDSGLPILENTAREDGPRAMAALDQMVHAARKLLGLKEYACSTS